MEIGAVDDERSVGSAETLPAGRPTTQQPRNGNIDAVIMQTLPEVYEQDWVFAVEEGDSDTD